MNNTQKTFNTILIISAIVPIILLVIVFYYEGRGRKAPLANSIEFETVSEVGDKPIQEIISSIKKFDSRLPETAVRPINLLFFGDVMLDRHVGEKIEKEGFDYLFKKLIATTSENIFLNKDIIGANLEGAVTEGGKHYTPFMKHDFAFSLEDISGLKRYGFNYFTLANNHFSDQGKRGEEETRASLDALGINYSGCADKLVGECSAKTIEIRGKKIGLAGFSMVYGTFNEEKASEIVGELASSTSLVIINIHWGREYEHNINPLQRQVAHKLIDAGADIIIGHHPHVIQGIELYKGRPIFYSLGNFIFDQYFSSATQEGIALKFELNKNKVGINLIPFVSKLSQLELVRGEEKTAFLDKIIRWSDALDKETGEQIKKDNFIIIF